MLVGYSNPVFSLIVDSLLDAFYLKKLIYITEGAILVAVVDNGLSFDLANPK